jgi:hypothetical protein
MTGQVLEAVIEKRSRVGGLHIPTVFGKELWHAQSQRPKMEKGPSKKDSADDAQSQPPFPLLKRLFHVKGEPFMEQCIAGETDRK